MLTLALSFSFVASAQESCKDKLETGYFIADNMPDYYIYRKKGKQTEFINNGDSKIVSKVVWINDNEYKIVVKKHVNLPDSFSNGVGEYVFTITECEGDSFTLQTTYNGEVMVFEMRKVNKADLVTAN